MCKFFVVCLLQRVGAVLECLSKDIACPCPLVSFIIQLFYVHSGAGHPIDVETSKQNAGQVCFAVCLIPAHLQRINGIDEGEEQVECPPHVAIAPHPGIWCPREKLHSPGLLSSQEQLTLL